jgi:CRISPR system Cascade subunit CasA
MNLATEAWIPIVWNGGKPGTVSLCDVFECGGEIQDLAVRPHERIALMRLLICVAQAALDGPADYEDWKGCQPRIVPPALEYLNRRRHAFELFGNGQRFLQVANLKKSAKESDGDDDEGNSTSKLDLALATGNNTTLFDNAGGSDRTFTTAELALMLTTFQCFSPGGRIGVALWNGRETPGKGSSNHAPCLAGGMLHSLLRGEHLLSTLQKNLLTKRQAEQFFGQDSWGHPVWELMPQQFADAVAVRNANRTYLGRLVPLTRAIWLADDCSSLLLANGLDYGSFTEDGWREPCATIVTRTVKGQPKRVVLQASIEKAAWRELHALTVKAISQNSNGGPAALQNISDDEAFDLWVGGLVANKAKPVDTTESVFHIPATMLKETSQMVYEEGVRWAEVTEFRVMRAVSVYHKELGDNLDRPEMRNRRQQIQGNATAQFWTDIESAVPGLLEVAARADSLGLNHQWHGTVWGRSVWHAARAAYERSCPHETPRQIRASALGLKTLLAAAAQQAHSETEQEAEA